MAEVPASQAEVSSTTSSVPDGVAEVRPTAAKAPASRAKTPQDELMGGHKVLPKVSGARLVGRAAREPAWWAELGPAFPAHIVEGSS
jgi:hypothetical protein